MSETTAAPDLFDALALSPGYERRERNGDLRPRGYDSTWWPCAICGRPTDPLAPKKIQVHMSEQGTLYLTSLTDEEVSLTGEGDMGWQLVGSSCAKKIPARFRSAG